MHWSLMGCVEFLLGEASPVSIIIQQSRGRTFYFAANVQKRILEGEKMQPST
eukprot:m.140043 g.140043  ORF g.140043 m.140043 type:complete len:52 (-) comp26394_c0_seq1:162-317(-)